MKKLKIALSGNPNSGKTTIFNNLTGNRQQVGNWPGVTVEKKEGSFNYGDHEIYITDLPGTYSLTTYSMDEKIARDFIVNEKPDVTISVIDSSNLERNLYLTTQILELGANVLLNLNMMDVAERNGVKINKGKLAKILDVPCCTTVAHRGKGTEILKECITDSINHKRRSEFKIYYGNDIEEEIEKLQNALKNKELPEEVPLRWLLVKLIEGDSEVLKRIRELPEGKEIEEAVSKSADRLEKHFGYSVETFIIERRYGFLEGVVRECMEVVMGLDERHAISDKIDKIITNRFLGIPIFLALMYLSFQMIFLAGAPLTGLIDSFFSYLAAAVSGSLQSSRFPGWVASLLSDGIIPGIGSVLIFFPNIFLLYVVIAVLEDSGYMARASFIMDKLMHSFGLHGKSFIPMVIGFGCNIPGILATRTLETRKDRILTILVLPLMSCSARLPIYILFASAFFPRHQGSIVLSLYVLGIILAILMARIFKSIFFRQEDMPLIMEMPPYRIPILRSIVVHAWERSSLFLKKAGTVIFAGVVIIWFLATFPSEAAYASNESILGQIGSVFAPLLQPAGFGNWQSAVALISGIVAKEIVVGSLGTLFVTGSESLRSALTGYFTPVSAYAFMVMTLIYIPCLSAIAAIKIEAGWKWALLSVSYTLVLGWLLAVIIFQVGSAF